MSNLNLKWIWIPIEILIDDNLSDKEKLIYSIILFLSKDNKYNSENNFAKRNKANFEQRDYTNVISLRI